MDLETLNEMFRERAKLVEAQFAACETADAAAACASGFLGVIREAYAAGCEDEGLRRRVIALLTACQSAAIPLPPDASAHGDALGAEGHQGGQSARTARQVSSGGMV